MEAPPLCPFSGLCMFATSHAHMHARTNVEAASQNNKQHSHHVAICLIVCLHTLLASTPSCLLCVVCAWFDLGRPTPVVHAYRLLAAMSLGIVCFAIEIFSLLSGVSMFNTSMTILCKLPAACVRACMRACARACVRACMRVREHRSIVGPTCGQAMRGARISKQRHQSRTAFATIPCDHGSCRAAPAVFYQTFPHLSRCGLVCCCCCISAPQPLPAIALGP